MEIQKTVKLGYGTVKSLLYSDKCGKSTLFLPKLTISLFSKKRSFWLKTSNGDKVLVTEDMLRELNMKLTLVNIGYNGPNHKQFMIINSPKRAASRIPLLAMSKKLNKIHKGRIDVRKEYKKRVKSGYTYWEPR